MVDTSPLRDLLARLDAATGPDREIDRAIHAALGLSMDDVVHHGLLLNAYTGSLDAAVALVKRALPGWAWSCGTCIVSNDGWVKPDMRPECPDRDLCDLFDDGFFGDARGGSVPLSLLNAMMQGLIARETVRAGLPFKSHLEARRESVERYRHEQAHGAPEATEGQGCDQEREGGGAEASTAGRPDGPHPSQGDAGQDRDAGHALAEPAGTLGDEPGVIARREARP